MPRFVAHSDPVCRSDTPRARRRTAWLDPLRHDVLALARAYLAATPDGTQVTLAVLQGLGETRLRALAEAAGRSWRTLKQDVGLFVVLVLIDAFGHDRVETLRHEVSGKNSTRSRTADWPALGWVSRYTPHRVRPGAPAPLPVGADGGGFRPRPYLGVNREERFFCFLVGHALLAHRTARAAFAQAVADLDPACRLDPDDLQVFLEAAALRDFWHDLGDPGVYDESTARRRRHVVQDLLAHVGSGADLDAHDLFWTSPARRKLWSPGRWSVPALRAAGLDELLALKWAFNAKPDFLLVSPGHALLLEAKVESGVGGGGGYDQLATQRLIGELLAAFVPAFSGVRVAHTTLGTASDGGLAWPDVADALDVPGLDAFTRAGLARAVAAGRGAPNPASARS
jgi:hypothetical protein